MALVVLSPDLQSRLRWTPFSKAGFFFFSSHLQRNESQEKGKGSVRAVAVRTAGDSVEADSLKSKPCSICGRGIWKVSRLCFWDRSTMARCTLPTMPLSQVLALLCLHHGA